MSNSCFLFAFIIWSKHPVQMDFKENYTLTLLSPHKLEVLTDFSIVSNIKSERNRGRGLILVYLFTISSLQQTEVIREEMLFQSGSRL